ncbi:MAG: methyltransferase domain-containing protein [Woeseiaceae bacterium]
MRSKSTVRLSPEDWSKYWRQPVITTFSQQFAENYDLEIQAYWDERFADVKDGGHIIDLATGNGAVALLAAHYAQEHGRDFSITGIDYADIQPSSDLASRPSVLPLLSSIRFLSNTNIESTGLAAGSASAIVSQFGFEYAEPEAAVAEAYRLLAPGGRISLIMHHVASGVLKETDEGLAQMQYMMRKERLDERVEAVIRSTASVAKTKAARQKLEATKKRLLARASKSEPNGFIQSVAPSFLHALEGMPDATITERLRFVEKMRVEVRAYQERMADLKSAAMDQRAFAALQASLASCGFSDITDGVLRYGKSQVLTGWTLDAKK